MNSQQARPPHLIWATRGRTWGFRFLLDAGLDDPLPTYERAFAGLSDQSVAWHRSGAAAALRIQDPEGRRDASGRVIPHEFVVLGTLPEPCESAEHARQLVWPLVERAYARVWDSDAAPLPEELDFDEP